MEQTARERHSDQVQHERLSKYGTTPCAEQGFVTQDSNSSDGMGGVGGGGVYDGGVLLPPPPKVQPDSCSDHFDVRVGALLGSAMKQLGGAAARDLWGAGDGRGGGGDAGVDRGGREGSDEGLGRAGCVVHSLEAMAALLQHGCCWDVGPGAGGCQGMFEAQEQATGGGEIALLSSRW